MEVLADSDSPSLISNAEVLALLERKVIKRRLKQQKENRRNQRKHTKTQHRDWIEEKVYEYLQNSPCVNADVSRLDELHSKLTSVKRQRNRADPALTSAITPPSSAQTTPTSFGLTEAEAIQICNFMPTEPVEIHIMVEELHDRMTESRQEDLLKCIASYRKDINDNNNVDNDDEEEKVTTKKKRSGITNMLVSNSSLDEYRRSCHN